MPALHERLDTVRLFEAAEAAVGAAVEGWRKRGGSRPPYPADKIGGRDDPACLRHFKPWEIEQACEFLVRVRMLEPRDSKGAAG